MNTVFKNTLIMFLINLVVSFAIAIVSFGADRDTAAFAMLVAIFIGVGYFLAGLILFFIYRKKDLLGVLWGQSLLSAAAISWLVGFYICSRY